MGEHLKIHGDGVKDIAFEVDDIEAIMDHFKVNGNKIVKDIWEEQEEDWNKVRFARIQAYDDTTHTFIEKNGFKGLFLPGYSSPLIKVYKYLILS